MANSENTEVRQRYILKKAMKRRYPDGNFKIVGEYEKKKPLDEGEGIQITLSNGETISVRNSGYYRKAKYRVYGYLQTENADEYVAVVKNIAWIFYLITALLALIIAIGGYFVWQMNQGPDIDPDLKDYISALKRPDNLDETQILIPSYNTFELQEGTKELNIMLSNPEDNPCYFKFIVVLDSTNEVLYESKLVPPKKGVGPITLNREMKEGTYKITVKIKTYDLNDYETEFNGAEVATKLKVTK